MKAKQKSWHIIEQNPEPRIQLKSNRILEADGQHNMKDRFNQPKPSERIHFYRIETTYKCTHT